MNTNYPMRLYCTEEDGVVEWIAEYPDLPGCIGVGDTREEACSEAEINKDLWIETAIENGGNVPEPSKLYEDEYSGKFNLRIPKSLHRNLSIRADEEGISLNQLCLHYISMGLAATMDKSTSCSFSGQKTEAAWRKCTTSGKTPTIPDSWNIPDNSSAAS